MITTDHFIQSFFLGFFCIVCKVKIFTKKHYNQRNFTMRYTKYLLVNESFFGHWVSQQFSFIMINTSICRLQNLFMTTLLKIVHDLGDLSD